MASYDQEWLPTRQFAEAAFATGVLIGEFPLWTATGQIRRRVDGILLRNARPFVAYQWKELVDRGDSESWINLMHGGNLVVIQTKLTTVSLAVLGQALASDLLIEARFKPAQLETVALTTGHDDDVLAVLRDPAFRRLRVELAAGFGPKRPRLEPKRDPELRTCYARQHLGSWVGHGRFPLTKWNSVESVYSRRSALVSPADFEGEDIVLVHTATRPHLDLFGHVVFGAALAKRWNPKSVSSRMVVREDDIEVSDLLAPFADAERLLW